MGNQSDPYTLDKIFSNLTDKLRAGYIFPDVAEQICQALETHRAEGAYNNISSGRRLAYTLTKHMQAVSRDEHLWIRWHLNPLPEDQESLLQNEEHIAEIKATARHKNYGIPKAAWLPGNIGLIEIQYFHRPEWGSRDTAAAAMRFVSNTHALIFDLRRCQGGNPHMVAFISSYLFNPPSVHLNSLYWRDEDRTEEYWTLDDIPGERYADNPVFVILSQETFSAGEEFAYNLQALGRAVLIGENTAGGAHPGSPFRVHPHFEAFIPLGRAINPLTKANWEGTGVLPDVYSAEDRSLDITYSLALEEVINSFGEPVSKPDTKLLKEARTALAKLDELKD